LAALESGPRPLIAPELVGKEIPEDAN
jgi:hypothetical protein